MSVTYKITTSGLSIVNGEILAARVFVNYGSHKSYFFDPEGVIFITFEHPQTPIDLGPLVTVEQVD